MILLNSEGTCNECSDLKTERPEIAMYYFKERNSNFMNIENGCFNEIKNQDDVRFFLERYGGLHDSVIAGVKYEPVTFCPVNLKDGSKSDNLKLTLVFNVYVFSEIGDTAPVWKSIEVEFGRLKRLNFVPLDIYGLQFLPGSTLKVECDEVYWGVLPYLNDELNEYGFSDKVTWVICETVKWREFEYTGESGNIIDS